MKIFYTTILLAVSLSLSACGNGQPSKKDAENIYNSNAKRTTIKVTDLRCDPAEHGSFSCFIAYQTYWTKAGAEEAQNFYRERHDIPLFAVGTPAISEGYQLGGDNDIDALMQSVKSGKPAAKMKENDSAYFTKVDGNWETDAFADHIN